MEPYEPDVDLAANFPDWVVAHRPIGVPEVMCPERRVILLDTAHSPGERRASLGHAVQHIRLGHQITDGTQGDVQEWAAERIAAMWLIPLPELFDAVYWYGRRWHEVAALLRVDLPMLSARVEGLLPEHRAELAELLGAGCASLVSPPCVVQGSARLRRCGQCVAARVARPLGVTAIPLPSAGPVPVRLSGVRRWPSAYERERERLAERRVDSVRRLLLIGRPQMTVGVQGDRRVFVAEPVSDGTHTEPGGDQQ